MLDLYQRNERLEVRKRTRLSFDLSELATSNRKGFDARCPISYGGTGTLIGNLSYTWDANKNKTSAGFSGTMSGYGFTSAGTTYDDEDRLTGYATCSMSVPPMVNNPTHKLLTADGKSLATDPKGISTVLSSSLTPQASRLLPVARTGTGGSVVYVQHDQQTIADYPVGGVASTPTNRYVYASYIVEPVVRKAAGTSGTIHYYHRNQQYSITAMTTSSGAVVERYAYTAYGQPTILNASGSVLTSSAVGNRYTYTGREWDETLGLHYFRARWMSPLAGRFLGRDPIGFTGSQWHLNEPLASSPLKNLDPFGNAPSDAEKLAECERLKGLYLSSAHVKPQNCKDNNWTISILCDKKGFADRGTASCESGNHVSIRIYYEAATTLEKIADAFFHELQHASDFCECGCSRFTWPKYPDNTEENKLSVCANLLCLEVRAFGEDNSCDDKPDDERRACIKKIIEDHYLKRFGCPAEILDYAMDKCYVKEGTSPPPFPELI